MTQERMHGTVYRLFPLQGYGFVIGEDGIRRFMHATAVRPDRRAFDLMREGQGVTFVSVDVADNPKGNGIRAVDVEVV